MLHGLLFVGANNMHKWQEKLLVDIETYVESGKELKIMMSGRRVGKSVFTAQAIERLMKDLNSRPIEDLVLSEGRVHGARYYCVEPIGGSWIEMEEWCHTVLGESGEIWTIKNDDEFGWPENHRWYANNRKFWFKNEKDRTMFIMRWSCK